MTCLVHDLFGYKHEEGERLQLGIFLLFFDKQPDPLFYAFGKATIGFFLLFFDKKLGLLLLFFDKKLCLSFCSLTRN